MKKDTCSKCGKLLEKSRLSQRYCLACHAEYMRNNRIKQRDMNEDQKKKANARSYLNTYLKRGKIKKEACCICSGPAQAHHDDYNKPLVVKWFCREHHLELHRKQKSL